MSRRAHCCNGCDLVGFSLPRVLLLCAILPVAQEYTRTRRKFGALYDCYHRGKGKGYSNKGFGGRGRGLFGKGSYSAEPATTELDVWKGKKGRCASCITVLF